MRLEEFYLSRRTCRSCGRTKAEHRFTYSPDCSHVHCQRCIVEQLQNTNDYHVACLTCRVNVVPRYLSLQRHGDHAYSIDEWRPPAHVLPAIYKIREPDLRIREFSAIRDRLVTHLRIERTRVCGFVHRALLQRFLARLAFRLFTGEFHGHVIDDACRAYMSRYPSVYRLFDPFTWTR
jgi:hypothetical protein